MLIKISPFCLIPWEVVKNLSVQDCSYLGGMHPEPNSVVALSLWPQLITDTQEPSTRTQHIRKDTNVWVKVAEKYATAKETITERERGKNQGDVTEIKTELEHVI